MENTSLFAGMLSGLDLLAEGAVVVFGIVIASLLVRVSYLLNDTLKKPVRYFVTGFTIDAFALVWEILARHFPYFGTIPADIRDFLLAIGGIFLLIGTIKISRLMLPADRQL